MDNEMNMLLCIVGIATLALGAVALAGALALRRMTRRDGCSLEAVLEAQTRKAKRKIDCANTLLRGTAAAQSELHGAFYVIRTSGGSLARYSLAAITCGMYPPMASQIKKAIRDVLPAEAEIEELGERRQS